MTRSVRSLPQYFSAVQKLHTELGFGALPRNAAFKQTCTGLTNFFGQHDVVRPKSALTLDNLRAMLRHLNLAVFEDARCWAMTLLAFFGLLRVGEYADGALKKKHLQLTDEGVIVTLPFSKTVLSPVDVRVAARDDELCPLAAMRHYLSFFTKFSSDAPIFVDKKSKPLSRRVYIAQLKAVALSIGLDPTRIAGHSLRRGGCTAMYLAGVSEGFIAAHGRWRSLAFRGYLDFVDATQWLPTQQLAARKHLPTREDAAVLMRLPGQGVPGRR